MSRKGSGAGRQDLQAVLLCARVELLTVMVYRVTDPGDGGRELFGDQDSVRSANRARDNSISSAALNAEGSSSR